MDSSKLPSHSKDYKLYQYQAAVGLEPIIGIRVHKSPNRTILGPIQNIKIKECIWRLVLQIQKKIQILILIYLILFIIFMTTNQSLIYILLLITVVAARQQMWVRYNGYNQQMQVFEKYFRRIKFGYYIDLGGFNPVAYSNTARLSNWKGLIVQANQQRARQLQDFWTDITTVSFAMSNVSGQIVTFYQATNAGDISTLSVATLAGHAYQQQKVISINLADLCHKYYKAKPMIMNIDLQGIGQIVLQSNDWANTKCVPDMIHAEDAGPNQKAGMTNIRGVLQKNNYVRYEYMGLNTVFIHQSKLEFFKKEAEANIQAVRNKVMYNWDVFCKDLSTILGKPFDFIHKPRTNPAYIQMRQPSIINIVQLNKYSNLISQVGLNRPILIMEYDEKVSIIYLGTQKFTTQKVVFNTFVTYIKINAAYDQYNLTIYVLDHRKYDEFNLNIYQKKLLELKQSAQQGKLIAPKQCQKKIQTKPEIQQAIPNKQVIPNKQAIPNKQNQYKQIIGQLKNFITNTILISAMIILALICVCMYQRYYKRRIPEIYHSTAQLTESQSKGDEEYSISKQTSQRK